MKRTFWLLFGMLLIGSNMLAGDTTLTIQGKEYGIGEVGNKNQNSSSGISVEKVKILTRRRPTIYGVK